MQVYKGDSTKGEIEILKEEIVFENKYATLYNDYVKFPGNKDGRYLRFQWNAPYGVMILPRDKEGNIMLIKNFRHENRQWSWEIPKGFGEYNLDPLACAKKELFEETGYTGQKWKLLKNLNSGGTQTYVFEVVLEKRETVAQPEVSEAIAEHRFFKKGHLKSLLYEENIFDPMTLFFITYALIEV